MRGLQMDLLGHTALLQAQGLPALPLSSSVSTVQLHVAPGTQF